MLTPEPRNIAPPKEVFPYPTGLMRWLLRAPLLMYRLGLGGFLLRFRLIVITTKGRKSGQPRHTPIEYRIHGSKIYLISGWGEQPNWVQNLLANPTVTVRAGPRQYGTQAHVVTDPGEVLRALLLFRRPAPTIYDALLARVTNVDEVHPTKLPELSSQLTVVRLDITDSGDTLPGIRPDLTWVWAILIVILGAGMVISRKQGKIQQDTA